MKLKQFLFISILVVQSTLLNGQTPVYEKSDYIVGVKFLSETQKSKCPGNGLEAFNSDNWCVTWADDDHQYTSWGDGEGFGGQNGWKQPTRASMGIARLEGDKDSYSGINVNGGVNPESNNMFWPDIEKKGGKCYGLLSVKGILYAWVAGDNSRQYDWQKLAKSNDHGATWEYTNVYFDQESFPKSRGFFCPTFSQFGKDYQGAKDEYIYHYAPENIDNIWDVQKPGNVTLMRCLIQDIEEKKKYEIFTGTAKDPRWEKLISDDILQKRKPVFSDPENGVMRLSVSYNAPLDRYILTVQQVDRKNGQDHIGIYEAPQPWGPWKTVLFKWAWDEELGIHKQDLKQHKHTKTVFWNFSNKWSSNDGENFVMVYTGKGPDEFGTVEGYFVIDESKRNNSSSRNKSINLQSSSNNNMVMNHLHNIYQKQPPLAKHWPPGRLSEWEKQKPHHEKSIKKMLNLPPEGKKSEWPLNLRYTKPDLDTTDFTLKYLAYQSRPNFWVTANLYIPKNVTLPAPAIMIFHGHSEDGKATEKYQKFVLNFVKKGYVVFFKDGLGLGERKYTGHKYKKKAAFLFMCGLSIDGLETWDNIRGVDLLCSDALNQWVDKDRIGATGLSGGSMQTVNLAVSDERIKAAAPVCRANTYAAEFKLFRHCICCVCATGIRKVSEQYHLLATVAPKPFLICSGTIDENHPLKGAQDLVNQSKKVYELYDKSENIELVVGDHGHELSLKFREAIYAFFNKHLNVESTDFEEDSVIALSRAQLDCNLPKESTVTIEELVYRTSFDLPPEKGIFNQTSDFIKYKKKLTQTIRDEVFGYSAYMPEKCDLNPITLEKSDLGSFYQETITYKSEPDIPLIAILEYQKNASNAPVIINITGQDDNVNEYIAAGYAVLSVKLRPNNENSDRFGDNWGVWARGMSAGKPSTGMRIYDILRSIDYLETRTDIIDKTRIGCIGKPSSIHAMYSLYASALDERIKCVIMERPVVTYKPETKKTSSWHEWDLDMYIPQILLHADVSQVASLIAPRPMLIIDGRDIGNNALKLNDVRKNLNSCIASYDLFRSGNNLSIVDSEEDVDYINWFDKNLAR